MIDFESTSGIRCFDETVETTAFWSAYGATSTVLNSGDRVRDIRIINGVAKEAMHSGEPLTQPDFRQIDAGIVAAKADFAEGVRV